ncbi:acyltransferase domain-containing protein [Streptomyces sp. NPDC021212]|uniref:acyltransferase domain-containing protein n=1 Tax=Streptomyces sp. NPDC021212 TaxID=3365118 RepID=UPI0037AD54E7
MSLEAVAVVGVGHRLPGDDTAHGDGPDGHTAWTGSTRRLLGEAAAEALPEDRRSPGDGVFLALGRATDETGPGDPLPALRQGGPAVVLDAARCPALLAVRLAWQSVRLGDCDTALAAAGVGDGAAAVALKRLDRALRDGDRVLATLCGEAEEREEGDGTEVIGPDAGPLAGLARIVGLLREPLGPFPLSLRAVGADGTGTSLRFAAPPPRAPEPPARVRATPAPVRREVVFAFAGQGHQWLGMGRELLRAVPAFREAVERCDAAVRAETGWSVLDQLTDDAAGPRLSRSDVLQPTLFTMQVALAEVWRSWGVRPAAVVGQSMGEVAAAHVAGALTLQDAVTIQVRRSALLHRISGKGTMALVELSAEEAEREIAGARGLVCVAGYNGPASTVLAGDLGELERILDRLEARDVYCKQVKDTAPSHSPFVEELRADLEAALAHIRPRPAAVPMYSTVTLERIAGPELTGAYWIRNLREPVRFASAVELLRAAGHEVFLEISGHPVLQEAIQQCLEHGGRTGHVLASGRRAAELRSMRASRDALAALGALPRRGLTPYQRALAPSLLRRPEGALR